MNLHAIDCTQSGECCQDRHQEHKDYCAGRDQQGGERLPNKIWLGHWLCTQCQSRSVSYTLTSFLLRK